MATRKIGLVGGTGPESTLIYYKLICQKVNAQLGGLTFPEMTIESIDLNRAMSFISGEDFAQLEAYVWEKINNLIKCNCEVIALTANTMHIIYDKLKERISSSADNVLFVSLPETTSEEAVRRGYKRVGLLGTIFTMQRKFLKEVFEVKGIEVVVPKVEEMKKVHKIIAEELEMGEVIEESQRYLIEVIEEMRQEEGIEAVVLGCTELPLALNDKNCPVECLDTMALHIERLVEVSLEEDE